MLDSRPKGRGFEPHRRHCVVSLSKNIYPSLVLVQPRKTRPYITERLFMGRKESNQTKQSFSINTSNLKKKKNYFLHFNSFENSMRSPREQMFFLHNISKNLTFQRHPMALMWSKGLSME